MIAPEAFGKFGYTNRFEPTEVLPATRLTRAPMVDFERAEKPESPNRPRARVIRLQTRMTCTRLSSIVF